MFKEAFVSYEVALLLKEKGFDVPVKRMISSNNLVWSIDEARDMNAELSAYCSQPTHQMAMAWLREEKHISIIIEFDVTKRGYCPYVYVKDYDCDWVCEWRVNMPMKYEEAVEKALKYALENLI